jgi:hypothetical protein
MEAERVPTIASISLFLMGNGPNRTQDYNNPLNFDQKQKILDLKLRGKGYLSVTDYVIKENIGGPLKQVPEFISDQKVKYPNLSTIHLIIVGGAKEDESGVKDSEKFNSLFGYVVGNLVTSGFNVSFKSETLPTVVLSGTTMSATLMRHTARTKTLEEFIEATNNFYGDLSKEVYTTIRIKVESIKKREPSTTTRKRSESKVTESKVTESKVTESNATESNATESNATVLPPSKRTKKGGSKKHITRKLRVRK